RRARTLATSTPSARAGSPGLFDLTELRSATLMSSLRVLLPSVSLSIVCLAATVTMIVAAEPSPSERARKFVAAHEAKVRPLEVTANLAWWQANTTGKDEDFKKKEDAQNRIDEALADPVALKE